MPRKWRRRAQFVGAIALPAVTAALVLGPIGLGLDSGTREVAGTRPSWVIGAADKGAAARDGRVEARIWLKGQDPEGTADYAQAVSDPRGPRYRDFLSPADYQQRFGPSPAHVQAVTTWAERHGLKVTGETGHYIAVSATVTAAEKAFAVPFHTYQRGATTGIAPIGDIRIPASLVPEVLTVTGLDDQPDAGPPSTALPPPPKNHWWPGPCSDSEGQAQAVGLTGGDGRGLAWSACGYTPEQLRKAYGADRPELTGKGVTIAVVNAYAAPTMAADLARYSHDHGEPLRPDQYREILSPGWSRQDICSPPTWYTEEAKDLEAVHGMAPDADLVYLGARDCTPEALNDALLRVVDLRLADIVSCSWGQTTDGYSLPDRLIAHSIFEQGAVEGIGFYVSSGDAGYEDPATGPGRNNGSHRLQVDYPASDPWVTAVGGTSLAIDPSGGYRFETGWGQYRIPLGQDGRTWKGQPPGHYPQDWAGGSGGGTSTLYEQPWYQQPVVPEALSRTLPGGAGSAKPMRVVPDIALDADPLTGMLVGATVTMPDGTTQEYAETREGGTSLSCPLFAGIQALAQQAQHGRPLGFANPAIYLRHGTSAYNTVTDTPLGPDHPVAWAMTRYTDQRDKKGPVLTELATTGRDGEGAAALRAGPGYGNATGVGSPNRHYLESYG